MTYLSKDNVETTTGLSLVQEQLLLAAGQEEDLVQISLTLSGKLEHTLLQKAWDQLVEAHAALRTIFRQAKNRTVQVVLKERPIPVMFSEASSYSAHEQCAPFDLAVGPLVRMAVVRQNEQRSLLHCISHPLIMDQESCYLLLSDLLALYHALVEQHSVRYEHQPPFRTYLDWLARQNWSEKRLFWQKHLSGGGAPTSLQIGQDALPAQTEVREWITCKRDLSQQSSQQLYALAETSSVGESALLAAAWAVLLSVYSGEEEVVFGFESTGRPAALSEAHRIIGRFANVLPQCLHVDGQQTVQQLAQAVHQQQQALTHYAHTPAQELPGYRACANTLPLFYSEVATRTPVTVPAEMVLSIEEEEVARYRASTVQASERPGALAIQVLLGRSWQLTLSAPTTRVDRWSLEAISTQLQALLESMAQDAQQYIADLALMPAVERERVLIDFNRTAPGKSLEKLVHQRIEEQAKSRPKAIAAIYNDEQITYCELNRQANRMAHWLRAQGFGRNDLAALFAERNIDMLVAILAVLKAGGAYIPLDPAYPDARLSTLLHNSAARVILTHSHLVQRSQKLRAEMSTVTALLCLDAAPSSESFLSRQALKSLPTTDLPCINEPHDLANVFFTSGSTGQPKGAMIEHIGMLNHIQAKIEVLNLDEQCRVAQNASHCFDISVWQFLAPLMVGGCVLIYEHEYAGNPELLLARLRADTVTVLELVPTMIEYFLQTAEAVPVAEHALPALRFLFSTGEALPISLCRKWLSTYPHVPIVNGYGATECSDDTTHEIIAVPPPADQKYISVGRPISNFKTYILNRWQKPVPPGCIGEIFFTGIGVGRGYLHDAERTQETFLPNPFDDQMGPYMYRTGDLGYFLKDGRIVFVGRRDYQVKVRGHRIELGEIEAALLRHPGISQCVAITRPDAGGHHALFAYAVAGELMEQETVHEFLATMLPEFMLPEQIFFLAALPLDQNGKIKRSALPAPETLQQSHTELYAPRNETEAQLVAIWQDVLETSNISTKRSFFELGGHSLKMLQVRARIKQHFDVDVDLKTLFAHRTIHDLAPMIAHLYMKQQGQHGPIAPQPVARHYALSHAQKRLWFLQQLHPASNQYTMPAAFELTGPLNEEALRLAIEALFARHALLRATFTLDQGQPVQRIASRMLPLPYHVDDLSELEHERRQERLSALLRAEAETGFDLEHDSLFRARLLKLGQEQHILVLTMHHIITDAHSWQIVEQELSLAYKAFVRGEAPQFVPLSIEYTDYAHWQQRRIAEQQLAEDERYWLQQLAGVPSYLHFPFDFARPPVQTFHGHSQHIKIASAVEQRLKDLCRSSDTTLFMLLLATIGTYLMRLCNQDDIVIGTPATGRNRAELEHLVGFFINTLPLRLHLDGNPSFNQLLARVRETALNAYVHQEYPFDLLVDRLKPVRDLSQSPIFSLMFQVDQEGSAMSLESLQVRPHLLQMESAKFDLTITFHETSDGLFCRFEYNTDLFAQATITRMLDTLHRLLEGIAANPQTPIEHLPILSAEAYQQTVVSWNQTATLSQEEYCLQQLFEQQALLTPEATALVWDNTELTYRELDARANQLARTLHKYGVGPETLVGVSMYRSPEMLIALIGILKAGAAYVPMDPDYPRERLAWIMQNAQIPVLLTQERVVARLPNFIGTLLCVDGQQAEIAQEERGPLPGPVTGANLAYVIYTSGSTGRPKGVQITHQAIVNFLTSMRKCPGLSASDILLSITTVSFDIAALELFLPLIVGARLVLYAGDASDGVALATLLADCGATALQATPATWQLLLAAGWQNTRGMKMFCGGEALSPQLARRLLTSPATLWNMYGPTETTVWSTLSPITADEREAISLGQPIANTQVYVLDRHLQPVPIGVTGELYIGGAGLARGYLRQPGLTAERFIPHPFSERGGARLYRTGDLARFLPDGRIDYLGRADSQIKLRGYRIEPDEIATALEEHADIQSALVILHTEQAEQKDLVAYVIPQQGHSCSATMLKDYLREKLPYYMLPDAFVQLEAFPLLPNGKVNRTALPSPTHYRVTAASEESESHDLLEFQIMRTWEDILHVASIGRDDDFFASGGHSLAAVVLLDALERRFTIRIPLQLLFQYPTIARLCAYLRQQEIAETDSPVPLREHSTGFPLFLLHPQGGGLLGYRQLVRLLQERAIYGIQAPGYASDEPPLWTIEEMAARYVEDIRRVQPQGPYHLAGWSFGGIVAFEMARRLEAEGCEVGFLGLLDTHPFGSQNTDFTQQHPPARTLVEIGVQHLEMDRSAFVGLDEEQQLACLLQRQQELGMLPQNASLEYMHRQVRIMAINQAALDRYVCSGPVQTAIHLMRASEAQKERQQTIVDGAVWERRTHGQVYVTDLPGDHNSFLQLPHVVALSRALHGALTDLNRDNKTVEVIPSTLEADLGAR